MSAPTPATEKRCPQCWRSKLLADFVTDGVVRRQCRRCRERYSDWSRRTLVQKLDGRRRADAPPSGVIVWSRVSKNAKTGPIPVSMSERGTCPPSCGLYEAGCYAEYGKLGSHWKRAGERGLPWAEFLAEVRALPEGQLWRHNEAGDLAGAGEGLDVERLEELTLANAGRRGFTFTHRYGTERAQLAVARANGVGFTVNLSADSLEEADRLYDLSVGPVAVLLPHDVPDRHLKTPAGRTVVVCPAQTEGLTCLDCRLCAHPTRSSVVGFRAHGQFKKHVPELVQLRRQHSSTGG